MTPPDLTEKNSISILPKDIDDSQWPKIRLEKLRMVNFGKHKDVSIDFIPEEISMNCLIGPNGIGKTTVLNGIQLLFANFNGYEKQRLKAMTLKNVRNHMNMSSGDSEKADFLVEGLFSIDDGTSYTVSVTRDGTVAGHPNKILQNLQHYCYTATFDRELHLFQLKRNRWPKFKELMEAVTGYEIEEDFQAFGLDSDPKFQRIIKDYVISFRMNKGREIIGHRQCSAGERKIVRTFSALLNRVATPSIILIDNVTDHVEASRHINVVNSLEKTFSSSQIIVTCHSTPIQRYLPNPKRILDLRFLDSTEESIRQQWRMKIFDELNELSLRLNSVVPKTELDSEAINVMNGRTKLLFASIKNPNVGKEEACDEFSKLSNDVVDLSIKHLESGSYIRVHGG